MPPPPLCRAELDFEGLAISIRAFHPRSVAQAREMELEGVDGDALSGLDAGAYRQLIMLLEDKTQASVDNGESRSRSGELTHWEVGTRGVSASIRPAPTRQSRVDIVMNDAHETAQDIPFDAADAAERGMATAVSWITAAVAFRVDSVQVQSEAAYAIALNRSVGKFWHACDERGQVMGCGVSAADQTLQTQLNQLPCGPEGELWRLDFA